MRKNSRLESELIFQRRCGNPVKFAIAVVEFTNVTIHFVVTRESSVARSRLFNAQSVLTKDTILLRSNGIPSTSMDSMLTNNYINHSKFFLFFFTQIKYQTWLKFLKIWIFKFPSKFLYSCGSWIIMSTEATEILIKIIEKKIIFLQNLFICFLVPLSGIISLIWV